MFNIQHKRDHHFPEIAQKLGFKFHNNTDEGYKIDWRYVGCLDLDEILQENDCERIEYGLSHISDASLGIILKNSILDPAVSKYFILAQYSIQYLQFCRTFLEETIYGINKQLSDNEKEITKLQKSNRKKNTEILGLHKKLESCIGGNRDIEMVYPCTKCTKNFISTDMLAAHMTRKHNSIVESSSSAENSKQDTHMINIIKLELEIKQLKEKLTAKDNPPTTDHKDVSVQNDEMQKQFVSVGIQTNFDEPKEKNDFEENMKSIVQNQQIYLENLHKAEIQRYEIAMCDMRRQLAETLNELKMLHSKNNTTDDQAGKFSDLMESRLVELRSLYSQNQNHIAESLSTLDEKYSRNFKNLEKIIESKKVPPVQVIQTPPKTLRDQAVLTEAFSYPIKTLNSFERDKSFDNHNIQSLPPSSDSSESDVDVKIVTQVQLTPPPSIVNRDKVIKTILAHEISKPQAPPIPAAEIILNNKLIEYGIDPDLKRLTSFKFSTSMAKLAEQRELSKRRFSKFFITRSNILRRLDKTVNEQFKIVKPLALIGVKPVPQPRRVLPDRTNIIEPALPAIDALAEPIQMYHDIDEDNSTSGTSIIEQMPTVVGDSSKPISKKRVIFDLQQENNSPEEFKLNDNVSDWEINSFSSDDK